MTTNLVQNINDLRLVGDSLKVESRRNRCSDPLTYVPDIAFMSKRKIRVYLHMMNSSDSTQNYNGEKGAKYAKSMLFDADARLRKNQKMNLPEGNNTKVIDPLYGYKLMPKHNNPQEEGIYFHYDDDLYFFINKGKDRNNTNRDVIQKYSINRDSVINIFIMPPLKDSLNSKSYKVDRTGVMLGNCLKVSGAFKSEESWMFGTLMNHEIGHALGLRHTWRSNDGCDDTPHHDNCWYSSGEPPCDGITSNNLMDYNNSQMAITPCQIGTIHRNISRLTSRQRRIVEQEWCVFKEEKSIVITERTHWKGAKDLEGHVIIKENAELIISCRISFPKDAKLIVEPGAKLVLDNCLLHNACGDQWDGIELLESGDKKSKISYIGKINIENIREGSP